MHKLIKRGIALAAALILSAPAGMPAAAFATTTAETLNAVATVEDAFTYKLISAVNTDLSATVSAGKRLPDTPLVNETYKGTEHQAFIVQENEDGTYKLIAQNCGLALEVKDGSSKNGTAVTTACEDDSKEQDWTLIPNEDGSFTVRNAASGTVLDVAGGSRNSGTAIRAYTSNGTRAQRFFFVKTSAAPHTYAGFYTIRSSKNQNYVLDIAGGAMRDKVNIQLYKKNDTAAQIFRIIYSGNGYYRIQGARSFKVLDVKSASTASGANVQQYKWHGGSNQRWRIVNNGDGTVTFLNKKSGKALDVAGALMQNGRNIQQYTPNGTSAQKWVLTPRARTNYTAREFLQHVRSVYLMAHNGGYRYGDSKTAVPCEDKLIACDRLIARALYDFGFRDQRMGGETGKDLLTYLPAHGLEVITDIDELQPGDIVHMAKLDGSPGHFFVINTYYKSFGVCTKYDMGSDQRIASEQPTMAYLDEWSQYDFAEAYRFKW